ncbi:MAG: putative oxidoreductase [Modestobacter sp.]|jgi:aryl-alcohol dehydrogenase-like predicted oxidoreductase|nr:putative oxidoreductase [Modestobacter sp.]
MPGTHLDMPAGATITSHGRMAADGKATMTGTHVGAQLGLGLAAIGRPGYITPDRHADLPADRSPDGLRRRAHELLDAAAGLGIRYVDAARSYGLAEQFLGSWLRDRADPPVVASKWGYTYTAEWRPDAVQHEVKDHGRTAFERQYQESRELLGPWLRLYQVHSLTLDSPLWVDRALQHRLAEVRADGVEVGFSTSGPDQATAIRRALELTVDGVPLFRSVQSTWNLLERSAAGALSEAHSAGLRVVVKEALANGRLTGRGAAAGTALAEVAPAAFARRWGVGLDTVAMAAALAQPWCDVVLSGAVRVDQLADNAAARTLAPDLDTNAFPEPQDPRSYWAARGRLSWA